MRAAAILPSISPLFVTAVTALAIGGVVRGEGRLVVTVRTAEPDGRPLPVRVIARHESGEHLDGSGRGLYDDGRFYADGTFVLVGPPGRVTVAVSHGPDWIPASKEARIVDGEDATLDVRLERWFSPREHGWYAGDNHVHAQHDRVSAIRTDFAYTALQARANGLDYITEAGSHVAGDRSGLDAPDFLFRAADEMRPGAFVGHLNTPGIVEPFGAAIVEAISRQPLPAQAVAREARRRGGIAIHTHPLTPPHQVHWMGATEIFSDAVLGSCADALDIESRASELLWFTVLGLGRRVAASASTDAALGRTRTRSPGDRRVWCRAERFDYAAIIDAIRAGRTAASNGGAVWIELDVDGRGPGDVVGGAQRDIPVVIRCRSRAEVRSVELVRVGRVAARFAQDVGVAEHRTSIRPQGGVDWILARIEDVEGNWCITSPVWIGDPADAPPRSATATVIQVSNATRFIELRREFFLHAIATVSTERRIAAVEILRDGVSSRRFAAGETVELPADDAPRLAVTELRGEYAPGLAWHPVGPRPHHVQLDWPVRETGWYSVRVATIEVATGAESEVESDAVWFDAAFGDSHAISSARLDASDVALRWWGYGEEMALRDIALPFEGDHWWYPRGTAWSVDARFGTELRQVAGGDASRLGVLRAPIALAIAPTETIHPLDGALAPFQSWLRGAGYRDPSGVFRVDGGVLRISGETPGYIGTRATYRDYVLRLEFRWGERNHGERRGKARDAGLFLHAIGPDGNSHDGDGAFRSAIECQIMEGAVGDLMLIRGDDGRGGVIAPRITADVSAGTDEEGWPWVDPEGVPRTIERWGRLNWRKKSSAWRDEFGFRGPDDVDAPAGEWTRLEVECRGDEIVVRVQGTQVNRARAVWPTEGAILLQSEGSEIEIRGLELTPLPPGVSAPGDGVSGKR